MKHIIRTRSSKAAALGRRAVGAALLATGIVLVTPALAGAQTDDTTSSTTTTVVDETTSTTTTVVDDTTTTTTAAPEVTTTTALPAAEPEAENIAVVFTPDETPDPGCLIGLPRETAYVGSPPESFVLNIVINAPLCQPIDAKAVIYGMPGGGEAWPQTLVETLPFTILEAGSYEVTFTKTCDPVQFDVLTGETPEVIAPLGAWHGPLLFPLDVNTSLQHFGCPEPEVEAVTTIAPEGGGIDEEVAPAELAFTGTSTSSVAATAGAALLLAGALLLLGYRRRTS